MKTPFIFRPQFILFYAEEASLSSGVGDSPSPASTDAAASPAVGEAFGATPEGEQSTGNVTAPSETDTAQTEPDFFEGIPSVEQLQTEAQQKVPYSEGLLKLRSELERIKPELQQYEPWKPVIEGNDPARIQERLQIHDSLFSQKLENGQPVLDERGLPQTTARPFLDSYEAKQPGFAMNHLLDVLDYQAVNPATGQKEALVGQFVREVLGLDVGRLKDYQNIDSLIAQTNGSITPVELSKVAEPDHEAYKSLPSGLRKDWEYMDEDTRRYHLDGAKSRMKADAFIESQQQAALQKAEEDKRTFETQVQETFTQKLTEVRDRNFDSLRDNLARVWQPSTDDAINQDRYDDVLAPISLLIDPDLQPMALKRLEREGIKVNAPELNQNLSALVGAQQTLVRAQAYGDALAQERAEQDFNRLQTQLMAKFNTIALKRAERYGMQAKQIADQKGELLTTASQVRPMVPNSTSPQTFGANGLPAGMDPRSSEAAMYQWQQSRGQA